MEMATQVAEAIIECRDLATTHMIKGRLEGPYLAIRANVPAAASTEALSAGPILCCGGKCNIETLQAFSIQVWGSMCFVGP